MSGSLSRRALFRKPAVLAGLAADEPQPAPGPFQSPDTPDNPDDVMAQSRAVPQVAVIADNCLNENGAYCRTCGEICAEGAIRFHLLTRGRARVDVDAGRCTGCGDCVEPCPVGAVSLPGATKTAIAEATCAETAHGT